MSRENILTGAIGEEMAANFLKRIGYRIIERNFRTKFGEIDIVAKIGAVFVFVEVKTRLSSSLGPPLLSVTKRKEEKIIKNALIYLNRHNQDDAYWRIDIVSVKLNNDSGTDSIELIENAVCDA